MIWKILLTALVIAGAALYVRRRNRMNMIAGHQPVMPVLEQTGSGKRPIFQFAAIGLVVLMLLGTGFYLYHQWQDSYQIIAVHVIDSRSGKSSEYEAYKGDVQERSFVTVAGRQVFLAETERLELGGGNQPPKPQ